MDGELSLLSCLLGGCAWTVYFRSSSDLKFCCAVHYIQNILYAEFAVWYFFFFFFGGRKICCCFLQVSAVIWIVKKYTVFVSGYYDYALSAQFCWKSIFLNAFIVKFGFVWQFTIHSICGCDYLVRAEHWISKLKLPEFLCDLFNLFICFCSVKSADWLRVAVSSCATKTLRNKCKIWVWIYLTTTALIYYQF